jgi:putative transposase
MKTFEFRLYPNKKQREHLDSVLAESRLIYNEMLEHTKQIYQDTGKFAFKYALNKAFAGRGRGVVPASTVQMLSDRLDKALKRFLRGKEDGLNVGFPRFKTPNRWHSIQLRQYLVDFELEGRLLRTPALTGGRIKIKRHRPIQGTPQTCHLVKRADGHWYALIVCKLEQDNEHTNKPSVADSRPSVGIDVGLKVFLADSDGNTVANPRFYQKSQATLRRKQRHLARCKKGSVRRRKAARSVAQTHLKIERQRKDFAFKTANTYAAHYRLIAVEALNINGMVHNHHLAKSIHDAAWGDFLAILAYKAASAGSHVVKVAPHYTSQRCSKCGAYVQKSLSVRTHICTECGYVADRDVNAARNILAKAFEAGTPPSDANLPGGEGCLRSPIL